MKGIGIDSGFYRLLEKFTNILLLNLLWIISCLPIITIFPATVAMFGVVRQWNQNKEPNIFKSYFFFFKENFLRSFIYGIIWFVLAFLLYFNVTVSLEMSGAFMMIMVSILMFFSLLFIMASVFLLPIMVHYEMSWINYIKNAILFSITQIKTTIFCVLILLVSVLMTYILPISFVIIWSMAAYNVYKLCDQSFKKMEAMI